MLMGSALKKSAEETSRWTKNLKESAKQKPNHLVSHFFKLYDEARIKDAVKTAPDEPEDKREREI